MNRFTPFEWIAAMRFMREGLVQTLLIVAGVALGVAVIVFMSAALAGLQTNIIRRTLNYMAPIVVIPPQQVARPLREGEKGSAVLVQPRSQQLRSIDQWQKVRAQIERLPDVTAVTPVVSGPGFALRGDANKAVNITGIEPDSYLNVISLGDKIIDGKLSVTSSDIIIGTELAQDLGAGVGDKLRLTTATGASATLNVTGIFDFGNKRVNESNVYISLHVAQSLLNLVGGVSSVELKVRDPFDAETIAQIIQDETGQEADSWIKTNAQFFTAMLAQTLTNRLIRFFVGLTAALGIASVLVVSVVQKSKEIGILRAMGTSSGQVLRLFLLQGAVMGLAGSVLGSGLSFVFLSLFRSIAKNPDGTLMFVIEIDAPLLAVTAIGATLVGLLAAALPARLAAQLDPAVAIRG
jgi:lipoprotein-releasing system permease protein